MDTQQVKEGYRQLIKSYISVTPPSTRDRASQEICNEINSMAISTPGLRNKTYMIYAPLRDEIDTKISINWLLSWGVRVTIPFMNNDEIMVPCQIKSLEDIDFENPFCPQPKHYTKEYDGKIDVFVTPARAIDGLGNRLGRGKGIVDRFLYERADPEMLTIVPAFSFQVLEYIPTTEFDYPIDKIITPTETINCQLNRKVGLS